MRRLALLAALLLVAAPVPARHLEDGGYRCDGGWCRDGEHREIVCTGDGCRGETRGFPTVIDPPVGDGSWLPDDDWVLGVEIDGQARAYPIRIISGQQGWEMIVDTLAGERIMATYCPLCASGIAFGTTVDGQGLSFRNSGAIWKRDMVMYDRETGSLWSQVAGEAIHGPHQGETLELIGSEMVRWSDWRSAHPDSDAVEIPRSPDGQPLCSCPSVDLDPARLVHGVEIDGQVLAFPLEKVREESVVRVDFAGRRLVATYRGDNVHVFDAGDRDLQRTDDPTWLVDDDGQRYHALTGRTPDGGDGLAKIPGKTTFTTRWDLFHPDSSYYQGGGSVSEAAPETGLLPAPGLVGLVVAAALGAWLVRRR